MSRSQKLLRTFVLLLAVFCYLPGYSQVDLTQEAKQLFEQERWPDLVQLLGHAPRASADLDYYYGVALAHQQRWEEARQSLDAGRELAPRDKRFPIELAGVAFKQKKYDTARRELRRALRLDPRDEYANEFLATIYFLDGNLEAALKDWNRTGKPEIVDVRNEPA
ncbi:MAG TPA: tetratricopeptide repeat protein, partial [Candidatus Angelobacter sp.]|nr:tetratricopeptide repeat protein [Candidatus Angelobacter sp.]